MTKIDEEKITVECDIAFGINDHTDYDIAQDLLDILCHWTKMNIQYNVIDPEVNICQTTRYIKSWPVFQLTGPKDKIKEWYLKDYNPGESFEEFLEHSQIK